MLNATIHPIKVCGALFYSRKLMYTNHLQIDTKEFESNLGEKMAKCELSSA